LTRLPCGLPSPVHDFCYNAAQQKSEKNPEKSAICAVTLSCP
jgi:hypothetical protein